jgi:hypothetical protein
MADNRLIAQIARKNGGKLVNAVIDTLLPSAAPAGKSSILGGIAGALAVRVATRSVPGAIVVGGALIAKRLYDRRREEKRPAAAEKAKTKA